MNETDLSDIVETTAKNMYQLLMTLASHIRTQDAEIADLKQKLEAHSDDLK